MSQRRNSYYFMGMAAVLGLLGAFLFAAAAFTDHSTDTIGDLAHDVPLYVSAIMLMIFSGTCVIISMMIAIEHDANNRRFEMESMLGTPDGARAAAGSITDAVCADGGLADVLAGKAAARTGPDQERAGGSA